MTSHLDLRPLQILASAIAGRSVEVAPASPGARTWTDGRTIYLESEVGPRDQLRLLGVQASLLAGDSLDRQIVAELRGHRSLATRYLAVEGHRALAANEAVLPPWMRSMVDHGVAGSRGTPADSLARARRDRTLEAAWVLGALDVRRIGMADDPAATMAAGETRPTVVAPADLELLDDPASDDPTATNLLTSPVGGGGPIGRLLAKLLRPTRSRDGGGSPGADAPTHLSGLRLAAGRSVVSTSMSSTVLDGLAPAEPTARTYPEWDERRQAYRPEWCQVIETTTEPALGPSAEQPEGVALRRALARLGTELAPWRRQRQGDDLDIDAIVEAQVDRAVGGPHVEDVYLDRLRRTRALSMLVLLDISGSAAEPGVAGRSVHEHQRDAAAALVSALHRLGDRVALLAFNSRGRQAVQVSVMKGFDGPDDERVAHRLAGLQPGGFTRLGAAIRHGSAVLEADGATPRRLLVVLTDGFAYDHGYEGSYGEADARRALLEARRRGTGCLCLSVGAAGDLASLPRVFGSAAHAAVPTTAHLAASIGPLFAAALRSADGHRRSFQRTERTRVRLDVERRAG